MDTYELIQDLLGKVENRYEMALVAAKRARLLNLGAEKLVETKATKLASIAMFEALAGKVTYKISTKLKKVRKKPTNNS